MRTLGIPYVDRPLAAWANLDESRGYHSAGRVPALVLDSSEQRIDSWAILDHLDWAVGPERALVPQAELERREVLRIVACAMGAIEKVVAALNKQTLHPPEKVHAPWVEHN